MSDYKFCICCQRELPLSRFSDPLDDRCNACIYACTKNSRCTVKTKLSKHIKKDAIRLKKEAKQAKIESLIARFRQQAIKKKKK